MRRSNQPSRSGKISWRMRCAVGAIAAGTLLAGTGCDDTLMTEVRQGVLSVATSGVDNLVSELNSGVSTAISDAIDQLDSSTSDTTTGG